MNSRWAARTRTPRMARSATLSHPIGFPEARAEAPQPPLPPGSLCGIPGLMPTYGRVSRYGLVAFASSLDKIGPFAGNVADAAAVLSVIAGHDANDSTSAATPVPDYVAELEQPVKGLRIGVPEDYFGAGLDPEV